MRCSKCGTENLEHAVYCKRCGASFKQNSQLSRRNKRILAVIILLAVFAAAVIAITFYLQHQKEADYQGKLRTADKYLQALDYEKAEAAYLEAIEIQPKKEDAYIKLADVYTEQGEYEKAEEILEKGAEKAESEKISSRLENVRLTTQTNIYAPVLEQYLDCVEHHYYIDQMTGEVGDAAGEFVNQELLMASRGSDPFQVYYALKDIDQNGTPELLIGAGSSEEEAGNYDVFCYSEETGPIKLFPQEEFGYRTNFTVFTDGIFEITSSGSVIDHGIEYYRISDSGYTPELEESISVFADYGDSLDEEPVPRYYHDTEKKTEITKEEFEQIRDSYRQKPEETFEWNLLTEDVLATGATTNDPSQAYYDLCMEYQQTYGEGRITEVPGVIEGTHEVLDGLCVAEQIDFNGDGNQELLLGYASDNADFSEAGYGYDIWAWKDGNAEKVLTQQANQIEGNAWIETTSEDAETYIVRDRRMEESAGAAEYLGYDGESFHTIYDIALPDLQFGEEGGINGSAEPDSEVIELHNRLARPYYPEFPGELYINYRNENGKRFFPLNTDGHVPTGEKEHESLEHVLQETRNTLQELKANQRED